jgi:preprotein translocase subunit SecG
MAIDRFFGLVLRAAELAFGAIVLGITAWYIDHSANSSWADGRFIYTLVVSCLAVLASLIWFLPTTNSFSHYAFDFLLFVLWIISFGLLVDQIGDSCGGVFHWDNIGFRESCGRFKALEAFTFLSAIVWLVSAILGVYFMNKRTAVVDGPHRSRWYRYRV